MRRTFAQPRRLALACVAIVVVAIVFALSACASEPTPESRRAAEAPPATAAPRATATAAPPTSPDAPSPAPTREPATTAPDDALAGDAAPCAQVFNETRVDLSPRGNRVSRLSLDLATATEQRIDLGAEPRWVLPRGDGWHVALTDGRAVAVSPDGVIEEAEGVDGPPVIGPNGLVSAHRDLTLFDNPLPDSRVTFAGDYATDLTPDTLQFAIALTEPTDRYAHGVLGDRIEAGAIQVVDRCQGTSTTISIDDPDVIEGISVLIGDVDDDQRDEILATISNATGGARLALWETDGTPIAESTAIGRGNRWRNQLAIAPVGPNGEVEVVDVRTPHIGGTVQYFRLNDALLERVAASDAIYTTHSIGSRNLDLGIVGDGDADGRLDVIVPTSDRANLAVLTRTPDGVDEVARRPLDGRIVTNLAVGRPGALAFGTSDGTFVVLSNPPPG